MASIVVCGGGVVGLSAAAMLADDGHVVTVLEADAEVQTAAQAWESWRRPGVAQFRQPHTLFARFRQVADEELPGLSDELAAAGCAVVDSLAVRPPSITDFEPRDSDDALRFVTGRRPVVEAVVAAHAQAGPGVTVRRGVRVHSLVTGRSIASGVPHVTGVRTDDGERIPADLVVDATGRRSPAERWLSAIGANPPAVEAGDRGFVYYSRYFTGPRRPVRMAANLTAIGSFSILTLDGDNDTWSVTIYGLSNDAELKAARDPAAFDRVIGACPRHAHWLDGTATTDVVAMAGILDRYRRFVLDDRPIVTGFAAIGDAWACTNPSVGRGLSTGLVHAQVLRRVVREHADDPLAVALAMDEETEQNVTPFVRTQAAADRDRVAEMAAAREGTRLRRMMSDMDRLQIAASYRADAFRGMLDIVNCMAFVPEVLARPAVKQAMSDLDEAPPHRSSARTAPSCWPCSPDDEVKYYEIVVFEIIIFASGGGLGVQERVDVAPRGVAGRAAGEHAEVPARADLEPHVRGVLQHLDQPVHGALRRDRVAATGDHQDRLLHLGQRDPAAAQVDGAVREVVGPEEVVVHLPERAARVGDHVVGEPVHGLELGEEVRVVEVGEDRVGLGHDLVDGRELEHPLRPGCGARHRGSGTRR